MIYRSEELSSRGLLEARRDWQRLGLAVLAVGILGLGLALYWLLRSPQPTGQVQHYASFIPPLLYGIVAFLVLIMFYGVQRDALFALLQEELVHQKMEAELNRELTLQDPVTEVYNRRYLRPLLTKEVSRAKRYSQGLSVIMTDITGFRRVNESLGHTGGDLVLRQIAHMVQMKVRNSDYIVRFGSDEFLLVLPDTAENNANLLAGRLQDGLLEWCEQRGIGEFHLRLAVGVASYNPGEPVEEMLRTAEQRMRDNRTAEPPPRGTTAASPLGAAATQRGASQS
jgi:diguanylate cyclase (GGDEF)-like protein